MASAEQVLGAIDALASVEGVQFDPRSLVEDVVGVAAAFPEPGGFEAAIVATVRMLGLIVDGRVDVSSLADDYEGWECCHYQPRAACGAKAAMRIMFARVGGCVRVRGFGERRHPEDFYRRMAEVERLALEGQEPAPDPAED